MRIQSKAMPNLSLRKTIVHITETWRSARHPFMIVGSTAAAAAAVLVSHGLVAEEVEVVDGVRDIQRRRYNNGDGGDGDGKQCSPPPPSQPPPPLPWRSPDDG